MLLIRLENTGKRNPGMQVSAPGDWAVPGDGGLHFGHRGLHHGVQLLRPHPLHPQQVPLSFPFPFPLFPFGCSGPAPSTTGSNHYVRTLPTLNRCSPFLPLIVWVGGSGSPPSTGAALCSGPATAPPCLQPPLLPGCLPFVHTFSCTCRSRHLRWLVPALHSSSGVALDYYTHSGPSHQPGAVRQLEQRNAQPPEIAHVFILSVMVYTYKEPWATKGPAA